MTVSAQSMLISCAALVSKSEVNLTPESSDRRSPFMIPAIMGSWFYWLEFYQMSVLGRESPSRKKASEGFEDAIYQTRVNMSSIKLQQIQTDTNGLGTFFHSSGVDPKLILKRFLRIFGSKSRNMSRI